MAIESPDLRKCRNRKDFGRGFYLTTDRVQAKRFTKTAIIKAKKEGIVSKDYQMGYFSSYIYHAEKSLKIFSFNEADEKWLHCVAAHRVGRALDRVIDKYNDFDVICGKIANDNTNLVITTYIDGLYGEIMTLEADRIAISFLEPDNLKDQFCFRTPDAISCLVFSSCEKVF